MRKFLSKIVIAFFVLLILFAVKSKTTHSQESLVDLSANYTNQLEEYQRAHNRYVLARSNYLRFKTLASEEQAFEATMSMLVERNDVVIAYLDIIIDRVENVVGLEDEKKEELVILLDNERDWFQQHSGIVTSAATLGELVEDSNDAKRQYESLNSFIYTAFSYISYARVNDYNSRLVDLFSDLRGKFESIRNDEREDYRFADEKNITINNWLTESQSSITRSEEALNTIRTNIDDGKRQDVNSYNRTVNDLQNARLHMQKATSYMKEVIREIKTQ